MQIHFYYLERVFRIHGAVEQSSSRDYGKADS